MQTISLIAHRGFCAEAPENSLSSFQKAAQLHFWAIETDIQETKDGILVCCHDSTINRMYHGSGEIGQLTWNEIKEMRSKTGNERMPLFREYLEICKRYSCIPFIETKTNDIRHVVEMAKEYFSEEDIIISSIQLEHLLRVREINKNIFIHHIFSDIEKMKILAKLGHAGVSYDCRNLDQNASKLIEITHKHGVKLCFRAGDTVEMVYQMNRLGLDYIPTNCVTPSDLS